MKGLLTLPLSRRQSAQQMNRRRYLHGFTSSQSGGFEAAKWQVAVLVSPLVGTDAGQKQMD